MSSLWWPAELLDELMPEGRDGPGDWVILGRGGRSELDLYGWVDEPKVLADGERVRFVCRADHGEATLTLSADGAYAVDRAMPPEAEQVCALDGWQDVSLAGSVGECAGLLLEEVGLPPEPSEFRLAYYAFSAPIAFRFEAATRSFLLAGPVS